MNTRIKEKQLQRHKYLATGLFLVMMVVFAFATIIEKKSPVWWVGYVRAFSEAAMVGALADWFAVTALFHHPFGLKIPHTNLIEKSKENIGDNLGTFVVDNFLSPDNIRPYIQKIKVSTILGDWLAVEANRKRLLTETSIVIKDVVEKLNDEDVVEFISAKSNEITDKIKVNQLLSQGLQYLLEHNEHQNLLTYLSSQIQYYIHNNREMIRERVQDNSYAFIPKFFDNKIAGKISDGLLDFFMEVEGNEHHPLRDELTLRLEKFAKEIRDGQIWEEKFDHLKKGFLTEEKLKVYANDIWLSIKTTLLAELSSEDGKLKLYLEKNLVSLADTLQNDLAVQEKTDKLVRSTAYKYILRNKNRFGELISDTVGNWKGNELSQKLELEVGKDLQYIRINGTLVGGLVGLLIYAITHFVDYI
ncbi:MULTISPECIES: DUF445 domain-containing protein [Amniculibacterium]|uniref:DUF445 domain-containing protein n=1 Tax=Amniculibacterium TaxID=2715289 RepID=UPI000F5914A7|nr:MULTISPECIES: DUF445 domain-containing protein [Amniculibacterium]